MAIRNPAAERQAGQLASGCAVAHAQYVRAGDRFFEEFGDAEVAENPRAVRSDLNARAFFGEFGTALANADVDAGAGERNRSGKAADAGAGDDGVLALAVISLSEGDAAAGLMALSSVSYKAALRIAFIGLQAWIEDEERRAIGAENLIVLTHVEIDMRVIERGRAPMQLNSLTPTKIRSAPTSFAKCGITAPAMLHPSATGDVWPHHILVASMMVGDIKTFEAVERRRAAWTTLTATASISLISIPGAATANSRFCSFTALLPMSRRTGSNTGWVASLTKAGYRVIAFDNRGHGESQKLYELVDYGAPLMAEDARRLLDHVGSRGRM